ncbi:autotransporter domain-containing protein [Roseomonas stagni]|uniref:Autotransporter domain-containing protein n=1 Tax=Falsiroseomonas algicola TaxID=2716930 RepID=A0A6M1LEZ9_9PROT|nr:autotransporter domain-containing protein [Falsiroseomonas algicola]NGM18898.1 autotransporter domain-containing protein [Falsiroseomonas algicola]
MAGRRMAGGVAPLLGCLAIVSTEAMAQDGTWNGGLNNDLGSGSNWTPDSVPTGTASFGTAPETALSMDRSLGFGSLSFEAGAPAYSIQLNGGFGNDVALTLSGAGIANASDFAPSLLLSPVNPSGPVRVLLQNGASLGNALVSGGTAGPTLLQLSGTATAGTASIDGVPIALLGASTLGSATVTNATSIDVNVTGPAGTATLGNATIGMAAGGLLRVASNGSLGTATITLGGGGSAVQVFDNATGDGARVNLVAGSALRMGGTAAPMAAFTLGTLSATGGTIETFGPGTLTILNVAGGALPVDITGPGSLTFAGSEARVLTGTSSLSGAITLQGGSLTVGNGGTTGSIAGNVALAAGTTLGFNRSDTVSYGGTISGAGGLLKQGGGALLLTAAHSFTGPTVIEGGSLLLDLGGSLAGSAVTVGAGGTFDISGATLPGTSIAGLSGAGTVRLGGNLLTVTGGAGTFAGAITDGGAEPGTGGRLLIDNGASLTLSGASTYTGATTVRSGTLVVNGSIASPVTVEAGGLLGGNGTVGPTTVAGRIAPGNSIGTLNVAGNLVLQSGSVTVMEVQGAAADRINVSGTAALAGTLQLVPIGTSFTFNTPFVLVNAAGGRTGAFDAVTTAGSFGPGVNPEVTLTGSGVTLVLQSQALTPSLAPDTSENVTNVVAALDARPGDASPFFGVLNAPAGESRAAARQLTGEVGTAPTAISQQAAGQFLASMLDGARLRLGQWSSDQPYSVWVAAIGGYARNAGEGGVGSTTRQTRNAGSAVGTDMRLGAGTTLGFAFAGGQGEATLDGGLGRASGEVIQGGLFGSHWFGPLFLGFAGSHTRMEADTSRSMSYLASSARAETVPQTWSTRIEAAYEMAKIGAFTPIPAFAYQGHWTRSDGYSETVAGSAPAAGLTVQPASQATTRTEIGLGGEYELGQSRMLGRSLGLNLRLVGRLAWAHYFDREAGMLSNFAGERSTSFVTRGARPDRNAALLGAGMELTLADRFTLHSRLEGEFSGNVTSLGGTARLRYEF